MEKSLGTAGRRGRQLLAGLALALAAVAPAQAGQHASRPQPPVDAVRRYPAQVEGAGGPLRVARVIDALLAEDLRGGGQAAMVAGGEDDDPLGPGPAALVELELITAWLDPSGALGLVGAASAPLAWVGQSPRLALRPGLHREVLPLVAADGHRQWQVQRDDLGLELKADVHLADALGRPLTQMLGVEIIAARPRLAPGALRAARRAAMTELVRLRAHLRGSLRAACRLAGPPNAHCPLSAGALTDVAVAGAQLWSAEHSLACLSVGGRTAEAAARVRTIDDDLAALVKAAELAEVLIWLEAEGEPTAARNKLRRAVIAKEAQRVGDWLERLQRRGAQSSRQHHEAQELLEVEAAAAAEGTGGAALGWR